MRPIQQQQRAAPRRSIGRSPSPRSTGGVHRLRHRAAHVRLTPEQRRTIVWPTVGAWSASTPGGGVILVLGPEPALRWRLFTQQLIGIAQQFDVSMVLTLGALLADVHYNRPVQLIGTARSKTPSIASISSAAATKGLRASSAWCKMRAARRPVVCIACCGLRYPPTSSQVPSPKASLALVERACRSSAPPPPRRLHADAIAYDARVSAFVADDADLDELRQRLDRPTAASSTTTTSTRMTTTTMTRSAVNSSRPEVNSEAFMASSRRFLQASGRRQVVASSATSLDGARTASPAGSRWLEGGRELLAVDGSEHAIGPPPLSPRWATAAGHGRTSPRRRSPAVQLQTAALGALDGGRAAGTSRSVKPFAARRSRTLSSCTSSPRCRSPPTPPSPPPRWAK